MALEITSYCLNNPIIALNRTNTEKCMEYYVFEFTRGSSLNAEPVILYYEQFGKSMYW